MPLSLLALKRLLGLVRVLLAGVHGDHAVANDGAVLRSRTAVQQQRSQLGAVRTVGDDAGNERVDGVVVVGVGSLDADHLHVLRNLLMDPGDHVGRDAVAPERTGTAVLGRVDDRDDRLDVRVEPNGDDLPRGVICARLVAGDVHDGTVLGAGLEVLGPEHGAEARHDLDVTVGVLHESVQVVVLLAPRRDERVGAIAARSVLAEVDLAALGQVDHVAGRRCGRGGLRRHAGCGLAFELVHESHGFLLGLGCGCFDLNSDELI